MSNSVINPYSPPRNAPAIRGNVPAQSVGVQPALHHFKGIGLGTFLGGPLAGGLMFAHNFYRLSKIGAAIFSVVVGVFATAALIGIGLTSPPQLQLGYLLPLAVAFASQFIAKRVFQDEYRRISDKTANPLPTWIGLIVGLAVAAVLICMVATVLSVA